LPGATLRLRRANMLPTPSSSPTLALFNRTNFDTPTPAQRCLPLLTPPEHAKVKRPFDGLGCGGANKRVKINVNSQYEHQGLERDLEMEDARVSLRRGRNTAFAIMNARTVSLGLGRRLPASASSPFERMITYLI
jgi:hypothetical protein